MASTDIINNSINIDNYYFTDCKFIADIKLCVHLYSGRKRNLDTSKTKEKIYG